MKKNILLVGGLHKAKALAGSLLKQGYQVTVINSSRQHCEILADMNELNVICGDGTKPYVLEEAEADKADIAIALTQIDEENLVICELCKKRFHVGMTVALVSDPRKIDFFYESGVDSVVCAINAVTGIIEQQVLQRM